MIFKKVKDTAIDPVCWMKVETINEKSEFQFQYQSKTYHFCAKSCLDNFVKAPAKALQFAPPLNFGGSENTMSQSETKGSNIYVCPMCPEIESEGPAACPKCGMALEPLSIQNADSALEYEILQLTKGLKGALIFGGPVVVFSMLHMFFPDILSHQMHLFWNSLQAFLSLVVMAGYGRVWLLRAFESFRSRSLNMFSLIGIGLVISYIYSLGFTVLGFFFHEFSNVMVYFESVCAIVILVFIGQLLEVKARYKTGDALRALLKLIPAKTLRLKNVLADVADPSKSLAVEEIEEVEVSDVLVFQRVRVLPGAKIPLDGIVISGNASVDEAMMTGESLPVAKIKGKKVFAGTHCLDGSIDIEVLKASSDTMLSKIISHVAEAQRTRAPIQKLVDQVSAIFVPSVFIISIITFLCWWYFDSFVVGLVQSVSVLMIACPCALGLATPMSIMVANGRAAQLGLLIRNSEILEQLSKIQKIAFDKTGTLTFGKLVLEKIIPTSSFSKNESDIQNYIQLAASLESKSEHPIAKGIIQKARDLKIDIITVEDFKVIPGRGVEGSINGVRYFCGMEKDSEVTIQDTEISTPVVLIELETNKNLCVFQLRDELRPESLETVSRLQDLGIEVYMLSGDRESVAKEIALRVGIPQENVLFRANPEVKINWIKDQQTKGNIVGMVGDGINDTPALAQADVGFAVKSGTDTAKQVAGVQILQSKITGIIDAISLSHATRKNIRQNLFFAFFYNTIGIPIASGLLIQPFGLSLSPLFASVAMSLSSLCVIANALRLGRKHLG